MGDGDGNDEKFDLNGLCGFIDLRLHRASPPDDSYFERRLVLDLAEVRFGQTKKNCLNKSNFSSNPVWNSHSIRGYGGTRLQSP